MGGLAGFNLMFDYNFHWRPVFKSLPDLLEASLVTLQVAVLSMVIGITIGLILSVIRLKSSGPLYWFASSWIELARNTPALFQLFFDKSIIIVVYVDRNFTVTNSFLNLKFKIYRILKPL